MSSLPIPGQSYTVQSGDTLSSIAARAYGDDTLWPKIKAANQSTLKSADPDTIFPGEIINIPLLAEIEALKTEQVKGRLTNKVNDELTIIVAGLEITVQSARIIRVIDTAADGWTAVIEWTPGENLLLDQALLPYAYSLASVYIGNELIINGLLYTVAPRVSNDGTTKALEGFSFSVDAVDSTIKPPYEKNNITLEQRAAELVAPLGIRAIFDSDSGGLFKRITAKPEDTIFTHLSSLASQRGLLVSSTPQGDLLFTQAAFSGSVGTIKEGEQLAGQFQARFDGRKRFNAYRAIGQSPGGNAKASIAIDSKVPRSRFMTFTANDTTSGNIKKAAEWRRSKQVAKSLEIPLSVEGWIAPNREIWKENTLVTLISESLHVPNGFTFLIKVVEFELTERGKTTNLQLVPPQVYTGTPIIEAWI